MPILAPMGRTDRAGTLLDQAARDLQGVFAGGMNRIQSRYAQPNQMFYVQVYQFFVPP
jgi:hypothetical protein